MVSKVADPLLSWSDMLVIAPLSAHTLARMVHGGAGTLLLEVLRAWDTDGLLEPPEKPRIKSAVVAPAMNQCMWNHSVTEKQIKVLEEEWGVSREFVSKGKKKGEGWIEVLRPGKKELACQEVEIGAMREWTHIVKIIRGRLWLGDG